MIYSDSGIVPNPHKDGFIQKNRTCLVCSPFGLRMVHQSHIEGFRTSNCWKGFVKKLHQLRQILSFCRWNQWIEVNPNPGSMRQSSVAKGAITVWWDMSCRKRKEHVTRSFLNVSHKTDFIVSILMLLMFICFLAHRFYENSKSCQFIFCEIT